MDGSEVVRNGFVGNNGETYENEDTMSIIKFDYHKSGKIDTTIVYRQRKVNY